ncbi:MAG TPA: carbohydrate-binding family 9-like protein [Candidatus Hydrogenedentes bacterium]|nr:carbohydrate-binding family 9-like protein [Candidatus Hydrogenedentota bacterium]HQM47049.1 carbohydrate-binding family 9-like protein [Candidatus Hydrogenedentota bacterium]
MSQAPEYTIQRASAKPAFDGAWDGPLWGGVPAVSIARFHPVSSAHRPVTHAKVLYDAAALYAMFRVDDRYVRATREDLNARVCNDACVEFFFEPKPGAGYFNFEMNCLGTLYASYVEDPTRTPEGLGKATKLLNRQAGMMQVYHSVPGVIFPERREPLTWAVEYSIPLAVLEEFVGAIGDPAGQTWRGNFYKCAEDNSHPHWASWAPIGEKLNFHVPESFALLHFAGQA